MEACIKEDDIETAVTDSGEKVVTVKLGKFRNLDGGEGSSSNIGGDKDARRRCFSMGSFEYVMDDNSSLRVPIRTPMKKQASKKPALPLIPGYRVAMSEYDCESRREFEGFATIKTVDETREKSLVESSKKESFSVSKIWLRGKEKVSPLPESTRRAFSFRFPVNADNANSGGAMRSKSEMGICRWEKENSDGGSEGRNSLNSEVANTPSFARRTLLWLMGRQSQNRVVHSSFTPESDV